MTVIGIRGTFFDFVDDPWKHVDREQDAARFFADGLLLVTDGVISDFGSYGEVRSRNRDVADGNIDVTHIIDRIILPGFIDGHIHVPQTRALGAYGQQLLPWLTDTVFPEELRYSDPAYAAAGTARFFDNVLAAGTTTVQAFTSSSPVSTEAFFDEASTRNMRVIGGLTGIDRYAPEDTVDTPENFYRDSAALIEKYHGKQRNLYAITPRFGLGASNELLDACRRLKQEHPELWVNTHVSENPAEIRGLLREHPDCTDYLSVYEKYGLVGPKFSGGHGVWLSDAEFARLHESGGSVTFCPCSNLFLGSGLFRLGRATDPNVRVRMSFGTDVGGGNRFSMLNVLEDAYKVGMLNNTMLDGSVDPMRQDLAESERNKLSAYRAFWSLTLGGAEGLYIDEYVGSFDVGKEADFVAIDWTSGPSAMAWHQSLVAENGPVTVQDAANLLFGVMMVGDERNIDETWIFGNRAYKKA